MIANFVGITVTHHLGFSIDTKDETGKILKIPKFYKSGINYDTHRHEPFKWEKTWYVWLLALISCCIFEYKLFADKKSNKEELKK